MIEKFARHNAEAEAMTARYNLKRHQTIARYAIVAGKVWWDAENKTYISRYGYISEDEAHRRLRDISIYLFDEIPFRSTVASALLYIIDYFTEKYKEHHHE